MNRSVQSYIETPLRVESHYVSLNDAFFGQNLPLLKKWHELEEGKSNFNIKLIQIYLCKNKLSSLQEEKFIELKFEVRYFAY